MTTGSLGWTFTLDDSNPVLQSLAEGQTITLVYIVTVSDGHGGTVDQEVTVTITGSNDSPNHAPTIVGELTTATGDVTEDIDVNASEQIAADGTITFRDVDLIDTHTASFVPASSTSNAHLPGFTNNTTYVGTFALNPVSEDNTDTDQHRLGGLDLHARRQRPDRCSRWPRARPLRRSTRSRYRTTMAARSPRTSPSPSPAPTTRRPSRRRDDGERRGDGRYRRQRLERHHDQSARSPSRTST